MLGCGERRRRAWISRRLLTCVGWGEAQQAVASQQVGSTISLACSSESKWFFMHLMATYFPFLMHWALRTSEKVPSPFFATNRYSARSRKGGFPHWTKESIKKEENHPHWCKLLEYIAWHGWKSASKQRSTKND